jgi:hypothetical protein
VARARRLALCADLLLDDAVAHRLVRGVGGAARRVEEDRTARLLALGLCAYLLRTRCPYSLSPVSTATKLISVAEAQRLVLERATGSTPSVFR